LINLGRNLQPRIVPEPLLAPPDGCRWTTLWSSESLRYGGRGELEVETEDGWNVPAEAAVALQAVSLDTNA
jgi:maltooligosyltrehalose trehalohydrolase